ncbi:methyltransferase domain-containing protein [Pseudoduganella buxea]|uniref:Methyltransferase domain-containing protein n=1 Tax=Pseudoduganella buxea TaxID=1949069 RepID=A0A6I3T185_9BURK|nr:methyltransferase domain-containing protein [Pseudoduganella buxea]MTV55351.1 methyltransferase domain-containing protein [Pseudoduganella buxea]GGC07669.1 hypothetical protein GCM10011572_31690 [Pseudoduganella buxea]
MADNANRAHDELLQQAGAGTLSLEALFNEAGALTGAGNAAAAIALYRAWLDHAPAGTGLRFAARFNLALALSGTGDSAGAEQQYRLALEENPGFAQARQNLELLLEQGGRGAEAQQLRDQAAVEQIPIVTVSYNSPDLIDALLASIRRLYPNPVYVIDGSHPDIAARIRPVAEQYAGVRFIPFGYNIHHGPGMSWAINNLDLHGPVLFLDSDVEVLRRGFLESLREALTPGLYGVGSLQYVNELGQPLENDGYLYLHPACMLCDIDVMRQWPLPIKHGAPMMPPMVALHKAGRSDLIRNMPWVQNDFGKTPERIFIKHDWMGTVTRTGGYHYDLPVATQQVDEQLLALVPTDAIKVVEAGCGDGSFAKAYKARNPLCDYTGIEPARAAADQARAHCDFVFNEDFDHDSPQRQVYTSNADCWVLPGTLDRLDDPAAWLTRIRGSMRPGATLVASVRNAQHWRTQVQLNAGNLQYGGDGALLPGQRHLFTRGTLLRLLQKTGFRVTGGGARMADEPEREPYLTALRALAAVGGGDPDAAVQDALPLHYLLVAVAA